MRIDHLIDDYSSVVNELVAELKKEVNQQNLLAAWLHRTIPQRGTLADGSCFQFHGVGCTVERVDDIDVDFDFDDQGNIAPMDPWRLWRFAKQFPDKYRDFQERSKVSTALEDYQRRHRTL